MKRLAIKFADWLVNLAATARWLLSDERRNPYRCCECGSTQVHIRAWVDPNFGNKYINDCEDTDDNWCEDCEANGRISATEDLLTDADQWWQNLGFTGMARHSGYRQSRFSPDDGYQAYVDACNAWWNKLTDEDKISLWLKATEI